MSHGLLYIFFLAFAALVSVAMWLDYFRQIDVFEKENVFSLILAVSIGGLTPSLSLYIYRVLEEFNFAENGEFINDALFSILGIGLNEELCKLLGVLFVFFLLKKRINEPIDYLIYAGVTALGFSLVENYNYFYNHGVTILTSRTFYSALEHIINSTIIIYGLYRKKIFRKGNLLLNSITGILLAVTSHGLFDFFLTDGFLGIFTSLLSLIIYLIGINFWIQMLNNANNYSSFFDYHKVNFTPNLVFRLFYWYFLTLVIAFTNNYVMTGLNTSIITFLKGLFSDGILFWIVILRVSRFKIFKMKYFKVTPALPFYITKNNDEDFLIPILNIGIKIRGENFREHLLTKFLQRKIELHPVNEKNNLIKKTVNAIITDKKLLHDDVIVYPVSIEGFSNTNLYVLKPKTSGIKEIGNRYPIEGLYSIEGLSETQKLELINHNKLKFVEWIYLKIDYKL
ncbi:PrsW family intramembrane metalloprotease [Aurantibacillus circumpalustris]|uniref:PrsW family intramembrane metalloprotease n=1 Tax=Aurantibacillus circumpalustris TaxID=3036359 RepID=UPI00295C344B|nr:PrsW family glutamic-type intramembrane protease [Aurantibacillus circumpalustris]